MPSETQQRRLMSLDVFRGITIAGMILVDSSGNDFIHPFLQHAPWNGWTFADLIFPTFLVIMGVSLAISLSRRMRRGEGARGLGFQILKRTAVIFSLGLAISLVMFDSSAFRIPGVLQRIALCYLACAILFLNTGPATQILVCAGLLGGYWLLSTAVPVPGHGPGVMTPDGNLACYVDRVLLGPHRLLSEACDPEGMLSTLPAAATALMGVLAGQWLLWRSGTWRKAAGLFMGGLACAAAGSLWGRSFPLNKHVWTSSYALFSGGLALAGLGVCYALIEGVNLRQWGRPFQVFGRNPLLSYFLSGLVYSAQESIPAPHHAAPSIKVWLCDKLFGFWLSPMNASLAYAAAYLLLSLGGMAILHRKKIFLKI